MTYMKLSEIADIFSGIRISRYENIVDGTTTKVLISKLTNNQIEYEYIKLGKINPKYYSRNNDIIMHLSDSINLTMLDEQEVVIPLNYAIIRVKPQYNPRYVFQILKTRLFQNTINIISEGSSIQFVKLDDLRNVKIKLVDNEKQNQYFKMMELLNRRIKLNERKIKVEEEYLNTIIHNALGENYVKL